MASINKSADKSESKKRRYLIITSLFVMLSILCITIGFSFIDSFYKGLKYFFTEYICGNLVIISKQNTLLRTFMLKRQAINSESISINKDFSVIDAFLKTYPDIEQYTPFSLFKIFCINEKREGIGFWLKVIDPDSFINVFSNINLKTDKFLKIEKESRIILTPVLKQKIENFLGINIEPGVTIFLSNKRKSLRSIEEATIIGQAIYKDCIYIDPPIAYTDSLFSRFLQDNYAKDEKKQNIDENYISDYLKEPETILNEDIIEKKSLVLKKKLNNQFYFKILNNPAQRDNIFSNKKTEWQYISLLLKPGVNSKKIMENINDFLSEKKLNLKIENWKTVSEHFYSKLSTFRIVILIVFFILYLSGILPLTYYLTTVFSTIKRYLKIHLIILLISILTGFLLGIVFLYALNAAGIYIDGFKSLQIFSGGNKLKANISILPVIIASISLIISYFLILVIFGVISFFSNTIKKSKEST